MIVDSESEKQLDRVLEGIDRPMLIVLPEREDAGDFASRWPQHQWVGKGALVSGKSWSRAPVDKDGIAYLLFTSGSTGVPKGVMVAHRNVEPYVAFITDHFSITQEDRFSQTFDMTFDLSVADMFVAWANGACVCCPSEKTLINPGRFIKEARISVWFSVPSMAVFMKRLGSLKPNSYPNLRVSMFCGEALPVEIAKAWCEAAPSSIVENIYGPTELTIACTYYRWNPASSPSDSEMGLVPIGVPFPGMVAMVADENLREVPAGESGELLMTGPQLALGYWKDEEKTAAAFLRPPGRDAIYYKTGDRVRQAGPDRPLLYLGRADNQVKILGHRVELGEIEAVVRDESRIDGVVALGWPLNPGGAGGVEVFLQAEGPGENALNERVSKRLPLYMIPRRYHYLAKFPLNANGKFDRRALLDILKTTP
jgi:amino acid adenylation domain-containing protein